MRSPFLILAAMLAIGGSADRASAQTPESTFEAPAAPGWTVTPSLGVSRVWDDNVLIQGRGGDVSSDFLSVLNPRATVDYNAKYGSLSAQYDGAFEFYRQFDSLNSYGQRGSFTEKRHLTSHTSFVGQQTISSTPTTQLSLLYGVPFVRVGARVADLREGVDHAFTKRTSLSVSYDFQWIDFDKDPVVGLPLIGGHAHGATAVFRHHSSERTTLVADYELQHATIVGGGTFTVENAHGGAEYRVSDSFSVSVELGIARLETSEFATAHTTPAWRAGVIRRFERATIDASYSRSFVPAFGVGGTLQDDDVTLRLKVPFGRHLYAESSIDWRSDTSLTNEPLTLGDQSLRSLWVGSLVGYQISPSMRVEGFYAAMRQNINRPGGEVDRHRAGVQFVTTKPVRIR